MNTRYINIRRFLLAAASAAMVLSATPLYSQSATATNVITVEPLFEYPVAPEDLPDLQAKTDWLMDHFWDTMDLSRKESVDQNALNDAFSVYTSTMLYASRANAMNSVNKLVKSLKGNPVLMLQFTKSAEESMFGPRAVMWCDETYIPFVKGLLAEKGISDSRKTRYEAQLKTMTDNAIGVKFPKLRLTLRNGRHFDFSPTADFTIVEFGNPDCDDCRFAKMKLEMAQDLKDMVAAKELEIAFIVADAVPEDQEGLLALLSDYPAEWTAGISYGADDQFDIRQTPSFYVLGKKGEILGKNLDVSEAVERVRALKTIKK